MAQRVVAIVQARMGSQRFPGKMMALLEGHPLIEWVLRRSLAAQKLDEVVLATTNKSEDEVLAEQARGLDVPVFRGSAENVLGRYSEAAREHRADIVVRICADRPLVAPEVVDAAIEAYSDQHPDIAFNHISWDGQNWPRGFGAEVVSRERLDWLDRNTTEQRHREHVTLYLHEHSDRFRLLAPKCPRNLDPGQPDVALDVDLPQHLDELRTICKKATFAITAAEVMAARARLATVSRGEPA
ncbi:MAG: hypothetical protein FJX64_00590 [Alphaproteobacteria bacterium]|nr:hypothetical protein [Alphaproteobacteria bacterium]